MGAITLSPGIYLNINLLEIFMVVAEHRSFTEAAQRTGRSHSAVSAQIRQLEEQLGLKLLHRTTRSVALTPAGETLLHAARQSLRVLGMAVDQLHQENNSKLISFACTSSVACTFMPYVLKKFQKRRPDVRIEMVEMKAALMIDPLLSGRFAFGVGPVPAQGESLRLEPLLEDPLIVLVPRSHEVARQPTVNLAAVANLPLMLPMKGSISRAILETAAQTQGLRLNVQYDGMQFYTLKALVRAGLGIAIMPMTTLFRDEPEDLAAIPLREVGVHRPVALITNPTKPVSDDANTLVALIRKEARIWSQHFPGR